jgi:putative chitinase
MIIEKTMRIDKSKFYYEYRSNFGSIRKQETVNTINAILDKATYEQTPIPHLAYMFATAFHEARDAKYVYDFYPLTERGSYAYITRLYWFNKRVRGWLGNDTEAEAWKYRGRGLVQLTGETNYEAFGIQDEPERALEPSMAVHIMFEGMKRGIFTGRKLSQYLNPDRKDYYNARRIINGTDKADLIATYAEIFERIIRKSIV